MPLHGTIPRQPSQRSHASRKCMAQLSLGSRRRQGHLSTTRTNRSATAVNMHAVIAGVRRRGSSPLGRWEHVSSPMHRRHRLCRAVCEKRLRGQLDPSAGSPGRSRRHGQRRSSHHPSRPLSGPSARQLATAMATAPAAPDGCVGTRMEAPDRICRSFDFAEIPCGSGTCPG